MKINIKEHELLEQEIDKATFETDNKKKMNFLFYGSIVPNIFLVIFGFVYLFNRINIIPQVIPGQEYILAILSIVLLAFFELGKREMIYTTSKSFFQNKPIIGPIIITFVMVISSFFLSLNGAKEIVDNTEEKHIEFENNSTQEIQKIDSIYNPQIKSYQDKIDYAVNIAQENNRPLWKTEREDIIRWEESIKEIINRKDLEVQKIENKFANIQQIESDKTSYNQLGFILISTLLELLLVFGVGYKPYYKIKVFRENQEVLKRNPNYNKYLLYKQFLNILYHNGKKYTNSNLDSVESFTRLAKSKGIKFQGLDPVEFLSLLNGLKITELSGKTRTALVDIDKAEEMLIEYFDF